MTGAIRHSPGKRPTRIRAAPASGTTLRPISASEHVWGTLTFGRTNTLASTVPAYDPTGIAGLSLIAFSTGLPVSAIPRRLAPQRSPTGWPIRISALRAGDRGGYNWDNRVPRPYQAQLGADFGHLSLDGVVSYAQNAVSLSSYSSEPLQQSGVPLPNLKLIDGNWFIAQKSHQRSHDPTTTAMTS